MTGRRKGTPCACETDPCSCGSSKGKCIRAINNVSPDPNGDFNIKAGTGIVISDGPDNEITIINSANPNAFVEGDNIDLIPSGDDIEISLTQDPVINGTLIVNGDIIQNGAAYETHAEKIYTRDDYIIMRDGAIAALAPGDYSGFQVKLYDGVNDGRLVIDNTGTARVGDVGSEQPLLTREESANLNNGALLKWDATNQKAVDEGTVGSDTKPIKIVNGVPTPITNDLGIVNSTDIYSDTVTAGLGAVVLTSKSVPSAGTYLIIAQIEIANAPTGTAILGIGKTSNIGWGISKTNTGTDYVRLTMSSVQVMSSTDQAYVNFYNGFGSNQSVNYNMSLTKLA